MERQEKLPNSWELVRVCRDMLKENYSDWQESKTSEEEKRKLQDIEEEKQKRLERKKDKQAGFKIMKVMETK